MDRNYIVGGLIFLSGLAAVGNSVSENLGTRNAYRSALATQALEDNIPEGLLVNVVEAKMEELDIPQSSVFAYLGVGMMLLSAIYFRPKK